MAGRFLFPFETGTPSLLRRGTSPGSIGRDPRFNPLLLGSNKPGLERGTRPSAPGAPGVGDPPEPDWDGSTVVYRGKPWCGVTRRGDPPRQFRGRMHRHPPGTDALLFRMLQVPRGPDHRRSSDHVPPSLPPVDPWRILPFLLAHVHLRCHPHGLSCPSPSHSSSVQGHVGPGNTLETTHVAPLALPPHTVHERSFSDGRPPFDGPCTVHEGRPADLGLDPRPSRRGRRFRTPRFLVGSSRLDGDSSRGVTSRERTSPSRRRNASNSRRKRRIEDLDRTPERFRRASNTKRKGSPSESATDEHRTPGRGKERRKTVLRTERKPDWNREEQARIRRVASRIQANARDRKEHRTGRRRTCKPTAHPRAWRSSCSPKSSCTDHGGQRAPT